MFGQIVRAHRRRLALSQEDLAHKAGVDARTIGNIEAGRTVPRPSTVLRLADALGLDGSDRAGFLTRSAGASGEGPPPTAAAALGGSAATPAQLPAALVDFTGRAAELEVLDAINATAATASMAPRVVVVSGWAGAGKTALVVHWAHRVRSQFPDGQLYVDLHGFGPIGRQTAPEQAIRMFLFALGVPAHRVPPELDAQAALYRTVLADRHLLVVLDNARDAEQVRPLLPGTGGAMVVVTSRNALTGLVAISGAHPVVLDVMSDVESHALLAHRLGQVRVDADPAATRLIIECCARLPLALGIAAATIHHRNTPIGTFAAKLAASRTRFDTLNAGDPGDPASDLREVFSWSYSSLTEPAARLFRLIGLHPGADLSTAAAASLAGLPARAAASALAELARAGLLVEHQPERYSCHDLLHTYAGELAQRDLRLRPQDATHRLLDHYLRSAVAADRALGSGRVAMSLPAAVPGVTPERPASPEAALTWFAAEHAALLALVQLGISGWDRHTVGLAWALAAYLGRQGYGHDLVAVTQLARAAAMRTGDVDLTAEAHHLLAFAYIQVGRFDDALAQSSQAIRLHEQLGDDAAQARHLRQVGTVHARQGRYAEALAADRRALDLSRRTGDRLGTARALNAVGWQLAQLGDYESARIHCEQALDLFEELDNDVGRANTCDSIGYILVKLGQTGAAIACYLLALDLLRAMGDRQEEAATLVRLGDAYDLDGDNEAARLAWSRAAGIYDSFGDADEVTVLEAKLNPVA